MAKLCHQPNENFLASQHWFILSAKSSSCFNLKVPVWILCASVTIFILMQILTLHKTLQSFQAPFPSSSSLSLSQESENFANSGTEASCRNLYSRLRLSVTFLPLKDVRFSDKPLDGHTWFISSLYDTHKQGEVQYQEFPSEFSQGRVLCLKGNDTHDGSWNYYAVAWPGALPANATLMKGLTFISYNHYDYANIWHGLSAMVPFAAWSLTNQCAVPERWVLYHWGEIRLNMGLWLKNLMEATFDNEPKIEGFSRFAYEESVCFEKAVVMRHNEGGMSRERRMEVYDLLRCRARLYCNVSKEVTRTSDPPIGMTLLLRTGPRSFKNESAVTEVFRRECKRIKGCRLMVAHSSNLGFCDQVKLMSQADILVSPHGAQLTNMFLMDRNSSVMEFFPKGWLKLAGVGQLVYRWMASWSGMSHEGDWRDPQGENCAFPEDDRRCMTVYKNGKIGLNETYFALWARRVLEKTKARKIREAALSKGSSMFAATKGCEC